MSVTEIHDLKETLSVEVLTPGHEPRVTTALFEHSKKQLVEKVGGVCFICGRTAEQSGHPLEAHHHPVEKSLTNMIDFGLVEKDFPHIDGPEKVDDMNVNGMLLCKDHHTGKDQGIHCLPYPLWIAQKYGIEGYKFSQVEVIHHAK